jgi:hypothetical protein
MGKWSASRPAGYAHHLQKGVIVAHTLHAVPMERATPFLSSLIRGRNRGSIFAVAALQPRKLELAKEVVCMTAKTREALLRSALGASTTAIWMGSDVSRPTPSDGRRSSHAHRMRLLYISPGRVMDALQARARAPERERSGRLDRLLTWIDSRMGPNPPPWLLVGTLLAYKTVASLASHWTSESLSTLRHHCCQTAAMRSLTKMSLAIHTQRDER